MTSSTSTNPRDVTSARTYVTSHSDYFQPSDHEINNSKFRQIFAVSSAAGSSVENSHKSRRSFMNYSTPVMCATSKMVFCFFVVTPNPPTSTILASYRFGTGKSGESFARDKNFRRKFELGNFAVESLTLKGLIRKLKKFKLKRKMRKDNKKIRSVEKSEVSKPENRN